MEGEAKAAPPVWGTQDPHHGSTAQPSGAAPALEPFLKGWRPASSALCCSGSHSRGAPRCPTIGLPVSTFLPAAALTRPSTTRDLHFPWNYCELQ